MSYHSYRAVPRDRVSYLSQDGFVLSTPPHEAASNLVAMSRAERNNPRRYNGVYLCHVTALKEKVCIQMFLYLAF